MYDFNTYPYPSRRLLTYAKNGIAATSQHLAAKAGADIMKAGGNAVDAAIAVASCLTVLEPQSNGLGSDNFAIILMDGKLYGLNSSGFSPALLDGDALAAEGIEAVPERGWYPVTVGGAPYGWAEMHSKFGRLPFSECLAPAIAYAEGGYMVSHEQSQFFGMVADTLKSIGGDIFREWFRTYTKDGAPYRPGDIIRLPDYAKTLLFIASSYAEEYYKGLITEKIDDFSRKNGGLIRADDYAAFRPEWVEPLYADYRNYRVFELPPNGQGSTALMALKILSGFTLDAKDSPRTWHLQIESMKLAFADALRYIAEPSAMDVPVSALLDDGYISSRRALISDTALDPYPGTPPRGGTVYLCCADSSGNMVSMIQSDYKSFGSGIMVPGTGVVLQDRGACFSMKKGHVNYAGPRKRPYHTIIPGFLYKDGEPLGPFGVMGGYMQPQGHLQVVSDMADFGMNPQAALDAPRWQWLEGRRIQLEQGTPMHIYDALKAKGHDVSYAPYGTDGNFGRGQIICRYGGGYIAGTEPRTGGAAIGL